MGGNAADTDSSKRLKGGLHKTEHQKAKRYTGSCNARNNERSTWQNFPTQSPICIGNDGISERLDFITFPKWRNESIKAAGNAVVPQIVYQIFKAIEMYELPKPI
jgi:DNA (cytosine-5)-methyltransferase 1